MPIFNTWASQQDPLSLSPLDRLLNQYIQKSDAPAAYLMRGDPQGLWKDLNTPKPVNMAQDMTDIALNANPIMGLVGATAYHGSPAIFDKFDINKIGSGEGAQAYGHGLYFAENPAVAKEYQKKLSGWQAGTKSAIKDAGGDIDTAIQNANKSVEHYKNLIAKGNLGIGEERAHSLLEISNKKLKDLLDIKSGVPENQGAFYKVDIPDEHIPKMLDWYKPLSEQTPEVQKALSNLPHRSKEWTFKNTLETLKAAPHTKEISGMNPTGQEIYSLLGNDIMVGNRASGQKYASDLLSKQGIKGIKYLDEGSRQNPYKVELYNKDKLYSASEFMQKPQAEQYMQQKLQEGFKPVLKEQGTNNFVVFDPEKIKILERNNKGLLGD